MGEPVNVGAGSGGPDRLAAIQAKVDEVGSLYKKALAARAANRTARVVVVVAILVVVIVFGLSLYSFVRHYPKEKILAELQGQTPAVLAMMQDEGAKMWKELEPVYKDEFAKSWPDVKEKTKAQLDEFVKQLKAEEPTARAELDKFVEDLKAQWPEVKGELQGELVALQKELMDRLPEARAKVEAEVAAFRDQFLKEWPDIQAKLQAEADAFVQDVQAKAVDQMQARVQAIVQRQQDKLINQFPELKDDAKRQIIMQNLQTAFQESFKTVMTDRIASGKERIARLYATILNFLPESRREGFQQRITTAWDVLLKKYQGAAPVLTQ